MNDWSLARVVAAFVDELRHAGVTVSPSESADALNRLASMPMLRRADTVQLRPRRNSDGLTEATKSKMRGKPKPKKAPASEPASRVASRPHSPLAITRVAMHGMYATKAGHLGL